MPELVYNFDYSSFYLYEIRDGGREFINSFADREDLLEYVEKNYDYAKIYCGREMTKKED